MSDTSNGTSLRNLSNHPVGSGRRVLLVEDDPDHVAIAEHYLRKMEGRVSGIETCGSLGEARPHISSGEFGLVLLDLTLPDSALEGTIESIAELTEGTAEIVAMSSLDVPEIRRRVREVGAAAFLSKTKLNATSLTELLDQLDGPTDQVTAETGPAFAAAKAAIEMDTPPGIDGRTLASKLEHDTNSWLANAGFRVAALRQHEGTKDCPVGQGHLDSIQTSLDAIASMVSGSRSLFMDEITPIRLEPVDLNLRFPKLVDIWRVSSPKSALCVEHSHLPVVAADEAALSNLLAIFANNVLNHGRGDHPAILRLSQAPSPPKGFATLTVTDDGGPWQVANPERITDPTFRGEPGRTQPGLGLYRARRWMERMGGSLEMVARADVAGAYAARLHFRLCD